MEKQNKTDDTLVAENSYFKPINNFYAFSIFNTKKPD